MGVGQVLAPGDKLEYARSQNLTGYATCNLPLAIPHLRKFHVPLSSRLCINFLPVAGHLLLATNQIVVQSLS